MQGKTHTRRGGAPRLAALPRRIHMLGIGGAGVSGAARILAERGHAVSGHDRASSSLLAGLAESGVEVGVARSSAECLPADAQIVVRSAAVPADDPQVVAAAARGLTVLKYAQVLPFLADPARTLAVAGTHGKTTTSWLLHHATRALWEAGGARHAARAPREAGGARHAARAPGALVGGTCRLLGTNAVAGAAGGWFTVEACEYDRSFLELAPAGAIVTNVEADHLDYYGSLAAIVEAFARFADRVAPTGLLVLGRDVPGAVESAARCEVWRLGREIEVELLPPSQGSAAFRARGPGWAVPATALAIPGDFNAENAALALALALGMDGRTRDVRAAAAPGALDDGARAAARGAARYPGAGRRFEPWGSAGGIDVVHDYAHHPTELAALLEAARMRFPGRKLHVLFQPHQHSRTARFLPEFAAALARFDRAVVADVYGARCHVDGAHSAGAEDLVRELARLGARAEEGGGLATAPEVLARGLDEGAVALVVGAGDVENVKDALLALLAVRGARRR